MVAIPNQSSIPKAFQEFDDEGRMRPSPLYDRVVDMMEELVKFTLLGALPLRIPDRPLQRAKDRRAKGRQRRPERDCDQP